MREHAALHRALMQLPALRSAVTGQDGGAPLGVCKALVVGRIATDETLPMWVQRARTLSVDELKQAVRGAREQGAGDSAVEQVSDETSDQPGMLWVTSTPPAVRAAFDSALDLYRRIEGGEATVTSFIEALVAEEYASGRPPDVFHQPLRAVEPSAAPVGTPSGNELPAVSVALELLAALDDAVEQAGEGSDSDVLAQLHRLTSAAGMAEQSLAALLIEMAASGALHELGFASIGAYAEARLSASRTTLEDRARAARALAKRPHLQRAYASGAIGLEKALLAMQILGKGYVEPAREREWVAHLESCSVKRLRDEKRALLWGSAVEAVADRPAPMSDEAWLASLRCAPGDTAAAVQRAGHAACGDGVLVPVVGSVLRLRLPVALAEELSGCIEGRLKFLALDAEGCDWAWPNGSDEPASWRAARTFSIASRRIPAWVGLLAMLEEFCVRYDVADKRSASHCEVFVRARHRCEAPGCTSRTVEWHHRRYRSRGGSDHHDNGDALCPTHH